MHLGAATFGSELMWYFLGDPCSFCRRSDMCGSLFDERSQATDNFIRHHIVVCPLCGWWLKKEQHINQEQMQSRAQEFTFISILKEFDCQDQDTPLDLVRSYVAKQWGNIKDLHPRKVEEIAASAFSDFFGCEVKLTAYSKDGGIDMYSVISNSPWAFQIKRNRAATEGVEKVREFLGAMVEHGVPNGIFVTTAEKFTKGALAVKRSTHIIGRGIRLELIDGHAFSNIFNLHYFEKSPPWKDCWPGPLGEVAEAVREANSICNNK